MKKYSRELPCSDTVTKACEDFCSIHPEASLLTIGNTILGKSIPAISVGNPNSSKTYLYVGGHHGSEWITVTLLLKFIEELSDKLKGNKIFDIDREYYTASRRILIIPGLNLDGIDLSINGIEQDNVMYDRLVRTNGGEDFTKWKANARGVDLNHNYNAGFAEYKNIEKENGKEYGAPSGYSGTEPESEPETAALCKLIRITEPSSLITLHAQGEEIYCSSCGKTDKDHEKTARIMARMTGYKFSHPQGTALYGGLTDWFIKEYGRPAFTIECGKGTNPLPFENAYFIYLQLRELLFRFPYIV